MPKNLIQRMQGGGPAIRLEQYVPGQHFEKALGDVMEYHKFNKELQEEKRQFNVETTESARQFDEKADLESERNSIMSRDITNRKDIAIMDEKRQTLNDARDDYIRISPKLPPPQRAALGRQYGLDDLSEEADRLGVRVKDAEKAINAAKASGDPGVLRQAINEHEATINEMDGWAPQYRANLELDLEGYAAQNALMTLKSTLGEEQLLKWGVNTLEWDKASPTQARVYLAQFPATMELKGKMEAADYNKLVKAYEIYAANQASMQELGVTGKQYQDATDNIARIGKEIGEQTGLDLTGEPKLPPPPPPPPPPPKSAVNISADAKKVSKSPLWKDENFMWISKDKKRKIFNARKAKQTLSKILNRNVNEKEARKIYEQLETVFGRTIVKAKEVIGEGLGAVGKGALGMTAVGRGVPPSIAFGDVDIDIPMRGVLASPQDSVEAQLQNQQDIEDIISGGIE